MTWPATQMLGGASIPLDQIGVLAFSLDGYDEPTFTPVLVGAGDEPTDKQGDRIVSVELRPLTLLDEARWRFVPKGEDRPEPWSKSRGEGDRILIGLDVAKDVAAGTLQVAWQDPQTGSRRVKYFKLAF